MLRRVSFQIVTHEDKRYCSVECPFMLHRDRPERLFCALTRGEIPDFRRTERCVYLDDKHGIEVG